MTPFFSLLLGVAITLVLLAMKSRFTGFRTQRPADLADRGPRFDLRTHLSGPILCEGVIYGPTGRVASRFVAEMEGVWDGNAGVLKERFRYDSGRMQDREWRLVLSNDGTIRAEADDVVGPGAGRVKSAHSLGQQAGDRHRHLRLELLDEALEQHLSGGAPPGLLLRRGGHESRRGRPLFGHRRRACIRRIPVVVTRSGRWPRPDRARPAALPSSAPAAAGADAPAPAGNRACL